MKRVSSSFTVRVLGMALGVVLVGNSVSTAFFGLPIPIPLPIPDVTVPGVIGWNHDVPMYLPKIGKYGKPEYKYPKKSNKHKIFVNCILHKVVASGSGYTNNYKKYYPKDVKIEDHYVVNSLCYKSIKGYVKNVCGSYPTITSSCYEVEKPDSYYSSKAYASIKCTATTH